MLEHAIYQGYRTYSEGIVDFVKEAPVHGSLPLVSIGFGKRSRLETLKCCALGDNLVHYGASLVAGCNSVEFEL
jgi:hypothetical protein